MEGAFMQSKKKSALTSKKHIIALLAILSLVIVAAGYFYYKSEESSIRQQKYNELKTIADLKESQIEQWLKERNSDVKVVIQSPFFRNGIYNWLQDTSNVQLKDNIIEELQSVRKELGYENIFIVSTNGHQLLSAKAGLEELDPLTKQKIIEASIKKEIVFTDFYFCQKENKIQYDIIAPIIYNGNKTNAIMLFRLDPNDYLFSVIENWPTHSKSAETVLIRAEKDSVLFLNELRHRKDTALKLKIPLTRTEAPAVQAALGHTGLFEGIDYRGVEVLSYIKKISGTNWIMLAKIDKSELYSNLYIVAGIIFGFSIFLIIICGVGFAYIYRTRQNNLFTELFSKEKELNIELSFQNEEKEKRAAELIIANKELAFQNEEKGKRAAELIIADKELVFQNREKGKRAAELIIANKELVFQNREKEKRAAELIIANKELVFQNEEKGKRAAELIIANKELESFSYSVSHDLSAPLRHINGYAELLLSHFYDSLPDKARHYLDNIADSASQMATLIDDLLQFSRTGRQEMRLANLDMNIIVQEVLAPIKQDNSERNIEWHIATLPHVYGDQAMLRLVWTNLLSNAVKFTRTKEKTIIGINVIDENDAFIFSIRDNGVGFDMQYAQKLFGVFQHLHPTDEFEGTGIGLANVHRIILRHGGRTYAEAEPDKGATFYFSLPKNKED